MAELNMVEAINLALDELMDEDDSVVVLGEDVGVDGGVFRVTEGLLDDYGEDRVLDTPLAESVIVGASVGMAANGLKPVCELQFSGFSYFAFHQIESHLARMRWRSRGRFPMPVVIRMPYGGGVRALEHHSESREVYYCHTPGLKVVMPSGPRNARALLRSAVQDPDPVIYMEPKLLYRAFREEVPEEPESLPFGEARVERRGDDITLIAWGAMLTRTLDAADELAGEHGIEAEVIDLRSLSPLDEDCLADSVRATGRALVVHEAPRSFGPGSEIIARINDRAFYYLKKPVTRISGFDTVIPFFARENDYLPGVDRIVHGARELMGD
jgi:pyruvate dehydrogenase E1 component beta subunit